MVLERRLKALVPNDENPLNKVEGDSIKMICLNAKA